MTYTHKQLLEAIAAVLDFDTVPSYADALAAYNWCVEKGHISPIPTTQTVATVENKKATVSSVDTAIKDRLAVSGFYSTNDRFFAGVDAETVLSNVYRKHPQLEWSSYGEKWLLRIETKEVEEILWFKKTLTRGGYSVGLGKVVPATIDIVYQKVKNGVPVPTKVKVANEVASDNHDLQSQATQGFKSSIKLSVLDWDYDNYSIIPVEQSLPFYEEKWQSGKTVIVLRQYNELRLFHKWWYENHPEAFNKYWRNYNKYLLKSWANKTTTEDHEIAHKMYLLRSAFERKYGQIKTSIIPTRVIDLGIAHAQDHQLGYPQRVKKAKSKISSGGGNPDVFSTTNVGKHQPTLEQAYRGRYYKDSTGTKYLLKLDDTRSMVWAIWPHKAQVVAKLQSIGQNNLRPIYSFSIVDANSALLAEHINSFLGIGKDAKDRNNTQVIMSCVVTSVTSKDASPEMAEYIKKSKESVKESAKKLRALTANIKGCGKHKKKK